MFEEIACILCTIIAWCYVISRCFAAKKTTDELRDMRGNAGLPMRRLLLTWWVSQDYADQLLTIVAVPVALCGFVWMAIY